MLCWIRIYVKDYASAYTQVTVLETRGEEAQEYDKWTILFLTHYPWLNGELIMEE